MKKQQTNNPTIQISFMSCEIYSTSQIFHFLYSLVILAPNTKIETIIQKEILEGDKFVLNPIESKEEFDQVISKFALKTVRP